MTRQQPKESSARHSVVRFSACLLPSAPDLIFLVLFFALTLGKLAPAMLGDAGIGWHIRNGQNILSTHAVPYTDLFSATMSGRPWFAWEWLYDAAITFVHTHAGLNGVVAFSALVIALTFALVFRCTQQRGASLIATLIFLLPCLVASSIHFLARPHVLGWLFTILWFWILDSSQRAAVASGRADPTPILLPMLMLLWVNLHGSFVMGFVLLAIYLVADLLEARQSTGEASERWFTHARMLAAVAVLSALTSLLNPYGYKLHLHVYRYLSNRFLMQHIQEFRAPDFHGVPAQFFLLLVAITLVAIFRVRARVRWAEWLIIAFSIFSGFWAARNLPVASMLLTMVGAPLLVRREHPVAVRSRLAAVLDRLEHRQDTLRGHLWPILLVAITAAACLNHGRLFGKPLMNAAFGEQRFPVHAVDFLASSGNRQPVLSLDTFGGYLIYRLSPDTKVFIDDRHDFYGEDYLKQYLKVIHVEPDWEQVLEGWHATVLIFPTQSRISDALRGSSAWKVSYSDSTATVFEKRMG